MDPAAAAPAAQPGNPPVWPRCAQMAIAFSLGAVIALLAVWLCASLRWGGRPTGLEPGAGPRQMIDLNRASRDELLLLPGVGQGLASRIDQYRREQGAFRSIHDLVQVSGVGQATLERLQPWVQVRPNDAGKAPTTERIAKPGKVAGLAGTINVNSASADELKRLPGIGPTLSERIVQERLRGPFKSVEDLARVRGIGPKTVERLRSYVSTENLALVPAAVD
jgi:competence protein ComEA